MKQIIIICGPTAVGKTATSVKLAQKLNTQIISSDSMQIYKDMNVGTAKVTTDEMQGIKHHMIDIVDPSKDFSVSDYCNKSLEIIHNLFEENKIPIIAGGTGLYINSLVYKMHFNNVWHNKCIREKYKKVYNEKGADYLYEILKSRNEKIANTLDKNNVKRVIRALEILDTSEDMKSFDNVKVMQDYKVNMYVLKLNRDILYDRINKRVDIMIKNSLIEEVKALMEKGLTKDTQSMKAIGYRQVISYLENEISKEEMIELIKRDSRRYAKKQYTWFRRYDFAKWIDVENKTIDEVSNIIIEDINI